MWPAPPSLPPSPWAAQLQALAPRGRVVRRAAATPKPAPKPAPKSTPKPTPRKPDPPRPRASTGGILGIAAVTERILFPEWASQTRAGYSVVYTPRAFDETLEATRRGRHPVALWVDHDRDLKLLDTSDPGFRLWADEGKVFFSLKPVTRRARLAIKLVRASGRREVSVGLRILESADGFRPGATHPTAFVGRVVLDEISIVHQGASPGTMIRFT